MKYNPSEKMVGDFTANDGTIDFYLRISSLISETSTVVDLGAGRAAWFEGDKCKIRKNTRLLKGKVKCLIAADVDSDVLLNRASDRQILLNDGKIDLDKDSVDLIVADYVLEHVENPQELFKLINHCLKSGGWFCARTPCKHSYVAIISSMIQNSLHARLLRLIQPNRKVIDVFPTMYKINRKKDIDKLFANWENFSFIYRTEPAYYFGNRTLYHALTFLHRFAPSFLIGNHFIFVKKP